MHLNINRFVIILAMMLLVYPTLAQVRRVRYSCQSSHLKNTYVDVYEYDSVDEQPQFPGGERGLVNYINKTRKYPYEAYEAGIEGRVLCGFIINTDGSVSNITVLRGCNEQLNREALRVISEMPKWRAGKVGDKSVPVIHMLPIVFRL